MRSIHSNNMVLAGLSGLFLAFSAASHAGNAHYWFFSGPTSEEQQFLEDGSAGETEEEQGFTLNRELEGTEEYPAYWAYANDAGRVRAFVSASSTSHSSMAGMNLLIWSKTYRKLTPDDDAHFTMNPSNLWLSGATPVEDVFPSASLTMQVTLYDEAERMQIPPGITLDGSTFLIQPTPQVQFEHHATIQRNVQVPFVSAEKTTLFGSRVYDFTQDSADERIVARSFVSAVGSGRYETEVYRGEINLSTIPVGGLFTIEYQLYLDVQLFGNESLSQAFLGDPLELDGGILLETDSEPLPDNPVICRAQSDPKRFVYSHLESTVTDTYSGLVWQRCPVNHALNSNGTLDDVSDDTCEPGDEFNVTWQAALQAAAADRTAGQTDWRLPNIKELDSIVAPACHAPAIDTAAFPNIPGSYWSSTPDPLAADSVQAVNFSLGHSSVIPKSNSERARLVRTGDTPAVGPLPALFVSRPLPLLEGDSGMTDMIFSIELDRVSLTDVTAHYQTRDYTATAGEDYDEVAGTIVIPAGTRRSDVAVAVLGDSTAEMDEAFYLTLSDVSANARALVASNLGQIDEDEPVLRLDPGSAIEGSVGVGELEFPVILSRASSSDVTFDYETADGTAAAGTDYVAVSGTGTIPAGSTVAAITIEILADTLIEGDESFELTVSNVSNNAKLGSQQRVTSRSGTIVDDDVITLSALNDTGVLFCADELTRAANCTFTPLFPDQDAQFGRDVTDNDASDGVAGFSFSKLDSSGAPLVDQSATYAVTPWECVRDEVTDLWLEVRTDDGGLRDKDWTYTWYNSTGSNDGGSAGTENGGVCVDTVNCDTEKYVAAVNAVGLCGRTDWRIPTREELQSIVDFSDTSSPPYDTTYFANSADLPNVRDFWTRTPVSSAPQQAWSISNIRGNANTFQSKNTALKVRLVRSGP